MTYYVTKNNHDILGEFDSMAEADTFLDDYMECVGFEVTDVFKIMEENLDD